MHDSLIIGVRAEPGYAIITAAGEIDIFTVAQLPLLGSGKTNYPAVGKLAIELAQPVDQPSATED